MRRRQAPTSPRWGGAGKARESDAGDLNAFQLQGLEESRLTDLGHEDFAVALDEGRPRVM
jgi:hypothetical protein